MHQKPSTTSSWWTKFFECLFVAVAVCNSFLMLLEFVPEKWLISIGETAVNWIVISQVIIGVLAGVAYSIMWHRKEKRAAINSAKRHAFCRGVLRYWLAFNLCTYGFAKILGTQFAHSYHVADTPVGVLNGFNLTWNYFSFSYTMAVIIALVQIGGSVLLLFRRTALLGAVILLPVMLNIVLINVFYSIAAGAFMNSVLFSFGLLYIISLHWKSLVHVFLRTPVPVPAFHFNWLKYLGRAVAVGGSFSMIWYFAHADADSPVQGKWKVASMIRNGVPVAESSWMKDSLAWQTVYFEKYNRVFFSPNPFVFEQKRAQVASFQMDTTYKKMKLEFYGPKKKTAELNVSRYTSSMMELKGLLEKDTVELRLEKQQ